VAAPRPAITGSQKKGPKRFSYSSELTMFEKALGDKPREHPWGKMLLDIKARASA